MAISDRLKKFNENILVEKKTEPSELIKTNSVYTELHEALSAKIMTIPVWFEYTQEEKENLISNFIKSYVSSNSHLADMPECEMLELQETLMDTVIGFGNLDLVLARDNVKTVSVSAPDKIICTLKTGTVELSEINLNEQQYEAIVSRLIQISGKNSSIIRFEFKTFLITIFAHPICTPKLIIEKLPQDTIDFEYLNIRGIINDDIAAFLEDSIIAGKRILLSSPSTEAAELILNAITNSAPKEKNGIVFLKNTLLKIENPNISVFDISGLPVPDKNTILDKYMLFSPEFIISAAEDGDINTSVISTLPKNTGCILSAIADNPVPANSIVAVSLAAKKNITDKTAKTLVAEFFDYIIQIENNDGIIRVQSISELYTTKSGTPVLKEILKYIDKEYQYDKDSLLIKKTQPKKKEKIQKSKSATSFSSRIKGK